MQYGFSKPILVKVAPGITAVERVKQEKLKSLHTKIKSLSLSSLLHFQHNSVSTQQVLQCPTLSLVRQLQGILQIPKPLFISLTHYSIYCSE